MSWLKAQKTNQNSTQQCPTIESNSFWELVLQAAGLGHDQT